MQVCVRGCTCTSPYINKFAKGGAVEGRTVARGLVQIGYCSVYFGYRLSGSPLRVPSRSPSCLAFHAVGARRLMLSKAWPFSPMQISGRW